MGRRKIVATMAGAALMVALQGGVAHADDTGTREPNGERPNGVVICAETGGTVWLDLDGNGTYDTSFPIGCVGMRGIVRV